MERPLYNNNNNNNNNNKDNVYDAAIIEEMAASELSWLH